MNVNKNKFMSNSTKNIKTYIILFFTSVTLLGLAYLYLSSGRYYISNSDNGKSYKIDRWTGTTWLLLDNRQVKVEDTNKKLRTSDSLKAINLVKSSSNLLSTNMSYHLDNNDAISSNLNILKGELNIKGWSSKKFSNQTYLVRYVYFHNGIEKSYNFDVNLNESIVRYVKDDPILLDKYSKYVNNYSKFRYLYYKLIDNIRIGKSSFEWPEKWGNSQPDYENFKRTIITDTEVRKKIYRSYRRSDISAPRNYEAFNRIYFQN